MNARNPYIEGTRYLDFGAPGGRLTLAQRALRRTLGLAVLPFALSHAQRLGTPGLAYRKASISLGLHAAAAGDLRRAMRLIADPMDSFRYFEIDFVVGAASARPIARYLDVSSPRLAPLLILRAEPRCHGVLLNPLAEDLAETRALTRAVGLDGRCRFESKLIEDAGFAAESFDLVTSVSVVEHIPEDTRAIASMWRLIAPGGRLLITVPCARYACDEYTNLDEYGLFAKNADGYVYWQRYYDAASLERRIWSVTGAPARMRIYGENEPGTYDANVERKRTDPTYPYWNEPVFMGLHFRPYDRVDQLPGMGVVAMEFVKP
jgi:SAM-dependent methyltransferase